MPPLLMTCMIGKPEGYGRAFKNKEKPVGRLGCCLYSKVDGLGAAVSDGRMATVTVPLEDVPILSCCGIGRIASPLQHFLALTSRCRALLLG